MTAISQHKNYSCDITMNKTNRRKCSRIKIRDIMTFLKTIFVGQVGQLTCLQSCLKADQSTVDCVKSINCFRAISRGYFKPKTTYDLSKAGQVKLHNR